MLSNKVCISNILFAILLVKCVVAFPQSGNSSPASSTTAPSSSSESINGPISDLEASFGGSTSSTAAPETTTINRRTGFYYLLDWNSFLDVDDVKGKHVNLRFQPKIGDPKRFFSIRTP